MSGYVLTTCAIMVPGILWASWIDYSERRVPNWLNASIAALGFMAQGWFFGWSGLAAGALGLLVGFATLIVPWLMHGMGAGDVKLMMAIGVWLGPWLTFLSFCVGAVVGGIIAVIMILATNRLYQAYGNLVTICQKVSNRSTIFSEFGSAKSFGETSQ
nr:A24 family peptidase [Phycisphaerae bacterium]